MKIIRLSLNNLASLAGTHHIDFESNPLAHAGLIAITGKPVLVNLLCSMPCAWRCITKFHV